MAVCSTATEWMSQQVFRRRSDISSTQLKAIRQRMLRETESYLERALTKFNHRCTDISKLAGRGEVAASARRDRLSTHLVTSPLSVTSICGAQPC